MIAIDYRAECSYYVRIAFGALAQERSDVVLEVSPVAIFDIVDRSPAHHRRRATVKSPKPRPNIPHA
jgi:hypothetical protein